jgi:hypothetical protein
MSVKKTANAHARRLLGLVLAGAGLVGACGADQPTAIGGSGSEDLDEDLSFASAEDVYAWLAETAARRRLADVLVSHDAEGRVSGLQMGADSRDILLAELGGPRGSFLVAGTRASLPVHRQARLEGVDLPAANTGSDQVVQSAVTSGLPSGVSFCSGPFCLGGESWNDHTTILGFGYHDIGGATGANGGVFTTYPAFSRQVICGTGNAWSCRPCYCPEYYCDPGDALMSVTTRGTVYYCNHPIGRLTVATTHFGNTENCASGVCQSGPVPIRTTSSSTSIANRVSSSMSAFGTKVSCPPGYGIAECFVNGVCSWHDGWGTGGSVIGKRTAAGSYNCD